MKTYPYRDEDEGHDSLNAIAQFKLNKGDIVNVYFGGTFYYPHDSICAYFEGHLIHKITE